MRKALSMLGLAGLLAAGLFALPAGEAKAIVWKDCQRIAMCSGCRPVYKCRSCSYQRNLRRRRLRLGRCLRVGALPQSAAARRPHHPGPLGLLSTSCGLDPAIHCTDLSALKRTAWCPDESGHASKWAEANYSAARFFQREAALSSFASASTQRAPPGPDSRFQNGALVLR